MPIIRFTQNIQRHLSCPSAEVGGLSAREALEHYFETNPQARGYVLDDQGRLRHHMAIFVDGRQIEDREGLSDALSASSVIDVVQALSGGCE